MGRPRLLVLNAVVGSEVEEVSREEIERKWHGQILIIAYSVAE